MKLLPTLGSAYSGSLRGITASHNKGGSYFRGRTIPTDPSSPLQNVMRTGLSTVMARWNSVLSQMQRDGWDDYAANVPYADSLGQITQRSGVNMYVRTNSVIYQANQILAAGLDMIDDAPTTNTFGVTPEFDPPALTNTTGPPNVLATGFTWLNSGLFTTYDFIFVWLSGGVNPGVSYFNGPYAMSGVMTGDDSPGSVDMYDDTPTALPWSNRFGTPPIGQKVFGYARSLMADGRVSQRARFELGVIPTAS